MVWWRRTCICTPGRRTLKPRRVVACVAEFSCSWLQQRRRDHHRRAHGGVKGDSELGRGLTSDVVPHRRILPLRRDAHRNARHVGVRVEKRHQALRPSATRRDVGQQVITDAEDRERGCWLRPALRRSREDFNRVVPTRVRLLGRHLGRIAEGPIPESAVVRAYVPRRVRC